MSRSYSLRMRISLFIALFAPSHLRSRETGTASRTPAFGQAPATSPLLKAEFDWSMPDRYGTDRNRDGRPDVPNSVAYVNNLGPEPCPNSTIDKPTFALTLDASESKASTLRPRADGLPIVVPIPITRFSWSVARQQAPGTRTTFESTTAVATRCFEEGLYDVTLTVFAGLGQVASVTKLVPVEDILIVSVGDSYASGEGNPERAHRETAPDGRTRVTTVWWADAGSSSPSGYNEIKEVLQTVVAFDASSGAAKSFDASSGAAKSFDASSGAAKSFDASVSGQTNAGKDSVWVETAYTSYATTQQGWEHVMAHRSTLAGPAQAALALEHLDKRTSVTFVFLAASGATIGRGVTASYRGVGNEPSTEGRAPLEPQLRQARALVRNRRIDAFFISVGGNDIGFSNIVTALVIRNNKDGLDDVETSAKDGNWTRMERGTHTDGLQWLDPNVGLDYLGDEYRKLEYAIKQELPNVFNIYLTEYPDPTRRPDGKYCNKVLDQAVHRDWNHDWKKTLGEDLHMVSLEVTNEELEWADKKILQVLNTRVSQAADANKWIRVSTYDASKNHGLCAPSPYVAEIADQGPNIYPGNPFPLDVAPARPGSRWFRRAKEAAALQGPTNTEMTKGTLHPNEYGERLYKERLLASLYLPVDIAGVGQRDTDDAIGEATVLRSESFVISPTLREGASWSRAPQIWPRSDVDMYLVHASNKERLTVTVVVDPSDDYPWLGPELDAAIRVFDETGQELVASDAPPCLAAGSALATATTAVPTSSTTHGELEPTIATVDWDGISRQMQSVRRVLSRWGRRRLSSKSYTVDRAGKYYAGISAVGNTNYEPLSGMGDEGGKSVGSYTLLLSSGPLDDIVACANPVSPPARLKSFANETLNDIDMFRFEVTQSGRTAVTLTVAEVPSRLLQVLGRLPSPRMRLFDDRGQKVAEGSTSLVEELSPGTYFIGISAAERGEYDPQSGAPAGGPGLRAQNRRQKPGFGWYTLQLESRR